MAPVIPDHTLLRRIGCGSYGEVWLGRNVMGTYRAVKVVYRGSFDDDRPYERELAGVRRFEPISRSHESQVQILHVGRNEQEGYFYYVMELADDASPMRSVECGARNGADRQPDVPIQPEHYVPRTLQQDLHDRGRLPFAECLRISLALAGALKHLHGNGLVHRDIKPSNIIFVNGVPKLADIGLVTEAEATITYVGAQGFMPPEGPGRPRGDFYSLGKVIYEMGTGRDRLAFPALPPGFGDWPDREPVNELLAVSLKACEPQADRRYASAEALLADLVMVQAGKSVRRLRKLERGQRRALAALAVGTLVGLLALSGAWLFGRVRHREVLVREADMLRLREPSQGWSSNVLAKLQRARRIHLDDDIRARAAAAFAGLDAEVLTNLTDYGAEFLTFDPEGCRLLMDGGATAQPARLWDMQSGEVKKFAVSGRGPVWFGREGRPRLLHAAGPGLYRVVSLEDDREVSRFTFQPGPTASATDRILPAAVSSDGTLAAVVVRAPDGTAGGFEAVTARLAVWRTDTGQAVWQGEEPATALAFSPDGACLALGNQAGGVQLRSVAKWALITAFTNENAAVSSLAFGRDPSQACRPDATHPWFLGVGTSGGTIWIHRLSPPGVQSVCRGASHNVMALAFAPDGMTLVSSGRDQPVAWDVATGRLLLRMKGADYATALAFAPDGRRLAIGMQPGFDATPGGVRLLAVQPDRGVKEMRGLSSQAEKVAFSRDGQWLAALAHNWQVGVWNLPSNRLEHLLTVPQGILADNAALAFSQDGSLFAFATSERAKLWDVRTGIELRHWPLPRGLQEHLWFDAAGRLWLCQWERPAPEQPGECVVRDLSRTNCLEPVYRFQFFGGRIFHSCLSSDGQVLAVCGSRYPDSFHTHVLKVFNPQSGQELCSLPAPNTGDCEGFCLDASGRLLAYDRGARGGVDFFEIPGGRLVAHSDGRVSAMSRGGTWVAERVEANSPMTGIRVWERDCARRSVVLGSGIGGPHCPEFCHQGRGIAWGTDEGLVLVAEIAEVFLHLDQLGFGWR